MNQSKQMFTHFVQCRELEVIPKSIGRPSFVWNPALMVITMISIVINFIEILKFTFIYKHYFHRCVPPVRVERARHLIVFLSTNFFIVCCCLGTSLKIVQLLQHFEHLVQPLAQAVETFVNEFAVKSIVSEVLRSVYCLCMWYVMGSVEKGCE